MADGPKKKPKRTLLEQVRKPTAPPSRKIGTRKAEEKVHPAGRSRKYKQNDNDDGDL